jgi:putative transcriptional regulator
MSSELITHVLNTAASKRAKVLLVSDSSLSYDAIIRIPNREDKFIIKVKENVEDVDKESITDLAVLARVSNSTPLIIGVRYGDEDLLDGVAYKVHGVFAVGITTFRKILNDEDVVFVKDKGMIKASVKGKLLRRLREERGMSLGDLAKALGVTRKTVYEYERGSFEASERTAQALMELFGREVLERVDLRPRDEELMDEIRARERSVDEGVRALLPSFKLYLLMRAHARIAAQSSKESYLVEDRHKISNVVINVAKVLGVGIAVIEPNKREVEFLEPAR